PTGFLLQRGSSKRCCWTAFCRFNSDVAYRVTGAPATVKKFLSIFGRADAGRTFGFKTDFFPCNIVGYKNGFYFIGTNGIKLIYLPLSCNYTPYGYTLHPSCTQAALHADFTP